MKVGVHFQWQNHRDWERFLAKKPGPPEVLDRDIYDVELSLVRLVEPLGFDSYWAIDHHFTPYVMTGGALQHLTFIAGATEKIDLGTMVAVLPWYDPLLVADQVSVLDNLLQGRQLTLGLGRGAAIREFDAFRVPMSEARGRFKESLDILRLALTNEWFSYDGEYFKIPETTIRPHYRNPERILERMRLAWTSPESLKIGAQSGLGMLMTNQKTWEEYQVDVNGFNSVRATLGLAPTQPTVVIRCACLETEDEAWETISKFSVEGSYSSKNHYGFDDAERFRNTKGYEQYATLASYAVSDEQIIEQHARPQAWGTPDQVFEKLREVQRLTGAEEFVMNFKYGTMPKELAERSMRLFSREVLPRLQAMDAPLDESMRGTADADLSAAEPSRLGF